MSLINKMLRDLDARHAPSGQSVLPDEVRPLPEEIVPPRVSRRTWIWGGLVLALAAALQTSSTWLPLLNAYVALPGLTATAPKPAAVPAAPPPPTTVVLQLPPPEQMLPLPAMSDAAPAAADVPAGASTPGAPAAAEPAPRPIAETRTGLKIDSSLPDVPPPKAPPLVAAAPAATPPAALPAAPSARPAASAPKSGRSQAATTVEKQQRVGTAQERAESEYRKGILAYKQGHASEAATIFKAALQEDPRHLAARQTLLSMLAEQKQWDEVQTLLKEGLDLMPEQIAWAMALARIQVERNKLPEAWDTLQKHMVHAEKSADYKGFAGVLLQRMQKPHEATLYYQAAVQIKPNEGRWWLGLGLAYEADNRSAEAREAFLHARGASGVSPEMAAVIDRKLR
jgi:MSHA biogenesis protein MshN